MTSTPRVFTLPGWQNSEPRHWQSRWELTQGCTRVEQSDWLWPRRGDWVARLEDVLLASAGPAILVAHSLACHLVAAWAAHSRHTALVAGALLVAPPDLDRDDVPPQVRSWRPVARARLPFASGLVCSEDDPFAAVDWSRQLAADWGSRLHNVGARGHVNADSGLGDWPEGLALLRGLGG
jgi:predicted alpha/beta hydrolase family esterase